MFQCLNRREQGSNLAPVWGRKDLLMFQCLNRREQGSNPCFSRSIAPAGCVFQVFLFTPTKYFPQTAKKLARGSRVESGALRLSQICVTGKRTRKIDSSARFQRCDKLTQPGKDAVRPVGAGFQVVGLRLAA